MAYVQWLPKNPLEVLEGHPDRHKTSLPREIYYPTVCAVGGFLTALLRVHLLKRPLWSSLPIHISHTILGGSLGYFYKKAREYRHQENEARAKYYIETHPEHFPDYPVVKIGDILEPWIPVR